MDMLQEFHMNKGQGEDSYAKNCNVQNNILSVTKSFVEEAIQGYFDNDFPETMAIADLGCSSGPTALAAVSEIMDMVNARCLRMDRNSASPKFMVFLNDLPGNDFNGVFASLSSFQKKLKEEKGNDFGPCFIAGLPGTFYGRLLPTNTLHFVHSSCSLHWLSQVPPGLDGKDNPMMQNKGKMYASVTSPSEVVDAYKLQFRKDFLLFLKSRAEEMISGGRMVLTLMGRRLNDPISYYPWEFLSQCLMNLVSEGIIEEEKVNSFNVPFYAPYVEELKQLVEEESSFFGYRFGSFEVEWDGHEHVKHNNNELFHSCEVLTQGERIAKMHRAVIGSMLEHFFGGEIMDELFHRYSRVWDDHLTHKPDSKCLSLVVSLIRN
ncbi:probable jasmonic acid carboxyl methyltransferase 2 [Beta vulgaris subsp. vulgaris]|uniref:probable jasmonic acid carboxyl methyltransferase 2 n=1 Tax=Beta vulgaris subsp. vulgaris TaxID=3555 RepID=UPI0020369ACE|nr:probable jasmonic acid carboxyl methyltransferase 2 [Beta vulgaris subsp. vulgaris]